MPNASDLTKYMFRQKTLELLYESRQLETHKYELKEKNKNNMMRINKNNKNHANNQMYENKDIIDLRSRLLNLFKILQEYWGNLVIEQEKIFIKILMDDVHIACKTLGTEHGYMYSCSRQLSQGSQFTYKVGGTNDTLSNDSLITEHYDDIGGDGYITSPSTKTPYNNVMILEMMQKVYNDEDEELE